MAELAAAALATQIVVIAQLPEDQRRAVELRYLKGCTVPEVANQMARTKEAIAKLLLRGLARLRSLLDARTEE